MKIVDKVDGTFTNTVNGETDITKSIAGWSTADEEVPSSTPEWSHHNFTTVDGYKCWRSGKTLTATRGDSPLYSKIVPSKSYKIRFYIFMKYTGDSVANPWVSNIFQLCDGRRGNNTVTDGHTPIYESFGYGNGNQYGGFYSYPYNYATIQISYHQDSANTSVWMRFTAKDWSDESFRSLISNGITKPTPGGGTGDWFGVEFSYNHTTDTESFKYNWDRSETFTSDWTWNVDAGAMPANTDFTYFQMLQLAQGTGDADDDILAMKDMYVDDVKVTTVNGTDILISPSDGSNNTFISEITTGMKGDGTKSDSIAKDLIIDRIASDIGFANFTIFNSGFTDFSSIDALYNQIITMADDDDNNIFYGEIKQIKYDFKKWTAKVICTEIFNKLTNKTVNFSPVQKTGYIIQLSEDDRLRFTANEFTNNEFQNDFVTIFDQSLTKGRIYTNTALGMTFVDLEVDEFTPAGALTPEHEFGLIWYAAEDLQDYTDTVGNEYTPYNTTGGLGNESFYAVSKFYFSMSAKTELEDVNIVFKGRVQYRTTASSDNHAAIRVMNFDSGLLENVYNFHDTNTSLITDQDDVYFAAERLTAPTNVLNIKYNFSKTDYSDYLTQVADLGNGDFVYSMDFYFYTGYNLGDSFSTHWTGICFYEYYLDVTYNTDQYITYGSRKIASNTVNRLTLDATDMPNYYPMSDKFDARDVYVITKPLSDIVADFWDTYGIYTIDFTTELTKTDTQIYNQISAYEVLKKYAALVDYEFWFEDNIVKCTSTFTDTGLTLTNDDIESITYSQDSSNLRNTLTVIGVNDAKSVVFLEPEYVVTDEDYVEIDIELVSSGQALDYATKLTNDFSFTSKSLEVTIRLNDTDKDYSAILLARTIGVKINDSGSILNFTSGNDGLLFIRGLTYYEVGPNDFLKLKLERRY